MERTDHERRQRGALLSDRSRGEHLMDVGIKLLMSTGDSDKRARYYQEAMREVDSTQHAFFVGQMTNVLLETFDKVILSHPNGAEILAAFHKASDATDFTGITEYFNKKDH